MGLAVIALLVVVFGFLLPDYLKEQEHKRQVREYTQKKLSAYEDENLLYGDYEVDVAFLGDSLITHGLLLLRLPAVSPA